MILVTGGTGLLGSHLVYALLKQGKKVRATHRKGSDLKSLRRTIEYYETDASALLENMEWAEADIMDVVALSEVFKGVREVYHCAAIVSFDPGDAKKLMQFNPQGTANVVNEALNQSVRKMVYVSSVAALGRKSENQSISENTEWVPAKNNNTYAISKYRAELEVWRGTQEGLNAVIVNPCIILGPGHWSSGSSAIFETIAKGFKFYTKGVNAYVDVRDVAEVMIKLMESQISEKRFVLAAENVSYKDIFSRIASALNVKEPSVEVGAFLSGIVWRLESLRSFFTGKKPVITHDTARTAQKKYYYDSSKIQRELPFDFRSLNETVMDMAQFYKSDMTKKM